VRTRPVIAQTVTYNIYNLHVKIPLDLD